MYSSQRQAEESWRFWFLQLVGEVGDGERGRLALEVPHSSRARSMDTYFVVGQIAWIAATIDDIGLAINNSTIWSTLS